MSAINKIVLLVCLALGITVASADCPSIQTAIDEVSALNTNKLAAPESISGGFLYVAKLEGVTINYYTQTQPADPVTHIKELAAAFHSGVKQSNVDGSSSCVYLGSISDAKTPNLTKDWDQVVQIQTTVSTSSSASLATTWMPTRLIIFGDSLSDIGYQDRLPGLPTVRCPDGSEQVKAPTWTSPCGHPWPYYLAAKLGVPVPLSNNANPPSLPTYDTHNTNVSGTHSLTAATPNNTNYAAGGSVSGNGQFVSTDAYSPPNLSYQVDQYINQVNADPSLMSTGDLYIIFTGSNDIFRDVAHLTMTTANQINTNIIAAVNKIKAFNSNAHILVVDVTDIGDTPLGTVYDHVLLNQIPYQEGRDLSSYINAHYDASVRMLDMFSPLQVIYTQTMPYSIGSYHFINNKNPACKNAIINKNIVAISCDPIADGTIDPEQYVFEDIVHPTDQMHQVIADFFYKRITDTSLSAWPN